MSQYSCFVMDDVPQQFPQTVARPQLYDQKPMHALERMLHPLRSGNSGPWSSFGLLAGFVDSVIAAQSWETKKPNEIKALLGVGDRFFQQRSVLISGFTGFVAILLPGPGCIVWKFSQVPPAKPVA